MSATRKAPQQDKEIAPGVFFAISLLGIWLLAAPMTFGFTRSLAGSNDLLCGACLIWLGEAGRKRPKPLWLWAIAMIGIWLQIAPLLFWTRQAASYLNDTLVGAWLAALTITIPSLPGQPFEEHPAIPPGWSYNPSSWTQRAPVAILAFICWMISRYLAAYQLGYIEAIWDPFFTPGTQAVLESSVSKAFPISDAGLGAAAYTIEFFSACQGGQSRWRTAPWLVLIFGILVVPVSLISILLIILQPLAVGTWCTLCLITVVCMLIAIPFAIGELGAAVQYLRRYQKKPFLSRLFGNGSCEQETPDKHAISMRCSLFAMLRSSISGIGCPWNLGLCALCGIALITFPSWLKIEGALFYLDPILGILTSAISCVSFAEYARKWRWINLVFAFSLSAAALCSSQWIIEHLLFAAAIALLSIRRGAIRERFGFRVSKKA